MILLKKSLLLLILFSALGFTKDEIGETFFKTKIAELYYYEQSGFLHFSCKPRRDKYLLNKPWVDDCIYIVDKAVNDQFALLDQCSDDSTAADYKLSLRNIETELSENKAVYRKSVTSLEVSKKYKICEGE